MFKSKRLLIVCAGIIILFPFVLNYLVIHDSIWETAGGPKDWLTFWPSYLSAITSAAMIAYTAKTLKYNDKLLENNIAQLEEIKKQWAEEHTPDVACSFYMLNNEGYIRLKNISNMELRNLTLKISKNPGDVTKKMIYGYDKLVSDIESMHLDIEPLGIRDIVISKSFYYDIDPKDSIGIHLEYNERYHKDYIVYFLSNRLVNNNNVEEQKIKMLHEIVTAIKHKK